MKRFRYFGLMLLTASWLWLSQGMLWALPFGFPEAGTPPSPDPAPRVPTTEIRGVWLTNVDSAVLFSRSNIDRAIQQLADYHFNTVYPVAWSWGYTLYPSRVGERVMGYRQGLYPDFDGVGRNTALEAAQGDRDVLQEVVTLAHDRDLSVIPWFEFGFMAPANAPLAQRHPDWLTQTQGSLPQSRVSYEGHHPRVWLNPFHPEVQRFILALISELLTNYAVDGLQLDDHFSLPVEYGYDPYTIDLYRREHGGQAPPADPEDAEWIRWRADKITDFMTQVFRTVKTRRPNAILSVSPNPAYFAYHYSLQDWPRWRDLGYVEELIVQVYRDNLASFRQTLDGREIQTARRHVPTGIGILTGLRNAPMPMSLVQQQVNEARAGGFKGIAFFFYESLWQVAPGETRGDREAALRQIFSVPRDRTRI